ncbi:deleted in malignant brain tumors 1 protein [Sinocyclocheilus anshuiensis]|uniref:deleted in malignant brain tumors 1 protein n=1 Tax=Sinocyclocheilus anshuiensis TaxID=1608454 RepID=UPI0007BA6460|nr:PREDICTED: deleted in malignant brain tumors 1 protein-like [Sinocyclocheilus anshuiensis]
MLCSMWLILFLSNTISSASESIRLLNGNNSCSGRLEVFYYSQWGTVCDDGWDLLDAAVVCKEMGCGDAIEAKSGAFFRPGSGNVLMSNIACVGNEPTLSSCSSKKLGEFICGYSKHAGVICRSLVRLVNGSHSCSGRVEVFNDGQWGTVCDNGWDHSDAAVICKEMGCGDVFEQRIGGYFSQGSGPVWLSDVQCSYSETTLRHCNLQGWGQNSCGHEKDAAVACRSRIKLENGFNACSGRVEIFYYPWGSPVLGTVCDNSWDLSDAAVVCREMGCGDAIAAKSAAYFGQGGGPVWLNDVNCVGNELTLTACESKKTEDYNLHYKDAGVICQSLVKLVNGTNSCSGRVEVFFDGRWGTVCDDGWDQSDAAVVCRELGCGNVIEAKNAAYFGQGSGLVWLSDLQCASYSTLRNCNSNGWGQNSCGHEKDAGVACQRDLWVLVNIKLVNGITSCSGRVEVFRDSQWGTVFDDGWDLSDAAVVCRQMGCGDAIEAIGGAYFGQSAGEIFMGNVNCFGNETMVSDCEFRRWGMHDHSNDAGVICDPSLRLINGHDSCSGRVEVLYNGIWGTVCDNGWDLTDAAAVCREMGCWDVIEAKSAAHFGQGSGPVWISDLQCSDTDSRLRDCKSSGWGRGSCGHEKDAGVICKGESLVKLVNGTNSCSGRVEVFFDGRWGTVCDDGWDQSDAAVVCRELGCGNVIEAKNAAYFGQGSGLVWLSDLQCASYSTLRNCNSNGWGQNSCGHEKDAGVACQLNIKLVNGITSCSGRVEVFRDSQWGTVFDDGWDLSDAAVVCRQMGCGDAIEAIGGAYFGQSAGEIFMGNVNCFGNETMVSDCEFRRWGMHDHSNDAGVICDPSLRLINGHDSCSGRVEVLYNGIWGTVCDNGWDLTDAAAVCREMGCWDVIEAKSAAHFGQGSGPVWISDLQCSDTDSRLRDCKSSGWGRGSCGHEKDAGVICKDNVRLVSSTNPCYGRVEVLRAGQWGTVCDDGWDASDAAVVCKQLGCGTVLEVKSAAYFGMGSGKCFISHDKQFWEIPRQAKLLQSD